MREEAEIQEAERRHPGPIDDEWVEMPQVADEATDEELWQAMEVFQKVLARTRQTDCCEITIHTDKPIGVCHLADLHLGNVGTDHAQVRAHAEVISETDGLYAMLGGDGVDNFVLDKLASAAREDVVRPAVQYRLLEYILRLFREKVLAVGDGNHDGWTERLADIAPLHDYVRSWPVVHTSQCGIVRLTVGQVTYVLYRQHKGRFNSAFNLTHTLKRAWEFGPEDWDIGIGEHHHLPTIEPFYRHGEKKVAIRTGTYKVYDQWARSQGFFGSRVGVPLVILWPDRKKIAIPDFLDDFGEAAGYLKYLRERG